MPTIAYLKNTHGSNGFMYAGQREEVSQEQFDALVASGAGIAAPPPPTPTETATATQTATETATATETPTPTPTGTDTPARREKEDKNAPIRETKEEKGKDDKGKGFISQEESPHK
jgi:hypothetical protein